MHASYTCMCITQKLWKSRGRVIPATHLTFYYFNLCMQTHFNDNTKIILPYFAKLFFVSSLEEHRTSQGLPYQALSIMNPYFNTFKKLKISKSWSNHRRVVKRALSIDYLHINLLYCGGVQTQRDNSRLHVYDCKKWYTIYIYSCTYTCVHK